MTETQEIILDTLQHPAVQAAEEQRRRAKKDAARLREIAQEAEREASEARTELGRIELAAEMGGKKKNTEDVRARLQSAEAKAQEAKAEAERRESIDFDSDIRKAIGEAVKEISEEAAVVIRDLTERYLRAMRETYELGEELSRVYGEIRRSDQATYHRHQVHGAHPPHESPVIPFKTSPAHGSYEKGMRKHFDSFRAEGYDI